MILSSLYISESTGKGRGVFTNDAISAGTIVEESPVIIMSGDERILLDKTLLHDYIFEWGEESERCCMALGYISVYNHSYESNCEYEMDFIAETIAIKSVRDITAGEELLVNYNGDWNSQAKVWFEAQR